MKFKYVHELAEALKNDPELSAKIKADPLKEIGAVAEVVTKSDPNLARFIISAAGLLIVTASVFKKIELKQEDLIVLAIAVIPWLFTFIETLKLGKDGIEIVTKKLEEAKQELKTEIKDKTEEAKQEVKSEIREKTEALVSDTAEQINQLKASNDLTKNIELFGAGGGTLSSVKSAGIEMEKDSVNSADPQKGLWSGKSEDTETHRKMTATVSRLGNEDYFRRVVFRVESTAPRDFPLTDTVTFHLHPTFKRSVIKVTPVNNVAEVTLTAYGAFTAGAATDNDKTKLEFDLTSLDDGIDPFFAR